MNDSKSGRSTRAAIPSATSTWRAKGARESVKVAAGHVEKEQVLDDAYDEYCRLRQQDDSLTATHFCDQYPSYRKSLRRLIDVHEALAHCPDLEEEEHWPELFTEFLGFEILHELGVGAMARVYLAAETALGGRLVAVKVSPMGSDEAETLGKLSHRNIVPVHSVQQDPETEMTGICMPYYGSATLSDLLEVGFEKKIPDRATMILTAARQREQLVGFVDSPEDSPTVDRVLERGRYVDGVIHLGIQMAEALEYTHEQGILHRDLKPSNVLLTPEGVPMLLDFNLATDVDMQLPRLGGTLPYMPPEQIWDVHLTPYEADLAGDPRSDVFSLAVILYELLTGKLPFGDPPSGVPPKEAAEAYLAAQERKPIPLRQLNPAVSRGTAKTIDKCLSLDIDERPATATEMADLLRQHFGVVQRSARLLQRIRPLLLVGIALAMMSSAAFLKSIAEREPIETRWIREAWLAIEEKRYRDAIGSYNLLEAEYAGANYPVLLGRGYCKWQIGELEGASHDLFAAYQRSQDLAVLDAAAYLAYQNRKPEDSRKRYFKGSQQSPEEPALRHLSSSFVALEVGKIRHAGLGPIFAIRTGVHPQIANHLAAVYTIELHDRSNQDVALLAIDEAVQHIENALSLSSVYPRLRLDAVRVYALTVKLDPDDVDSLAALKRHAQLAIEENISRSDLTSTRVLSDLEKSAEWYAALMTNAPQKESLEKSAKFADTSSFPADLLARPSRDEILDLLDKAHDSSGNPMSNPR
jgi:serine/threonine protein kinase